MPDLQFVLMVLALCTSGLSSLNVPESLRTRIFDRCWSLLHESPPPTNPHDRVLDLREGTEVTLDAMVEIVRRLLAEADITTLTWEHAPSEPSASSTPEVLPLIERLQKLYPEPPDVADPSSSS